MSTDTHAALAVLTAVMLYGIIVKLILTGKP